MKLKKPDCILYACCGSKCKKKGGKAIYKQLKSRVKAERLKGKLQVIKTGCTDRCKFGPVVATMPDNQWHFEVTDEKANNIFDALTLLPGNKNFALNE